MSWHDITDSCRIGAICLVLDVCRVTDDVRHDQVVPGRSFGNEDAEFDHISTSYQMRRFMNLWHDRKRRPPIFKILRQLQRIVTPVVAPAFQHIQTHRRTGGISRNRASRVRDAGIARATICVGRTGRREGSGTAADAEIAVVGNAIDIGHACAVGNGAVAWRVWCHGVADIVRDEIGGALLR